MIQDIFPHHFSNQYDFGREPRPHDVVFHILQRRVLVSSTASPSPFPEWEDVKPAMTENKPVFLFTIDTTAFFLCLSDDPLTIQGYAYEDQRSFRRSAAPVESGRMFAFFTALHLDHWYRTSRYCGCCGKAMIPGTDERRMDCPSCGARVYPRINPAVIVGVTNGDRLLITRYAPSRNVSVDALIAGFCEIGETLEDTVRREVREEAGLEVKNIRYYRSQPWGIADDLLAGFYCDADGDTDIHMDKDELSSAVWVERQNITGQPDNYSLTNEMMLVFRAGKEPKAP